MTKLRSVFVCQQCGHESPKWLGRCPGCGQWNTFAEEVPRPVARPATWVHGSAPRATPLQQVDLADVRRTQTGIGEFDRVLGGGVVPGSVLLFGGDPGIGKSTLLLQAAAAIAAQSRPVLYVSGEESDRQTRLRAERLGRAPPGLLLLTTQELDLCLGQIDRLQPALAVIDSIQTMYRPDLESAPGGVGQVRECAAALLRVAKSSGVAIALIGHVTKSGEVAGPRVLEHMVDAVLYFEGDRHHAYRVLRAVKNRFGTVSEIGLFEMTAAGLQEVPNPSQALLAERPAGVAGSVVTCSLEGTRPLLCEVQALVGPAALGAPRRTTAGIDPTRVALVMAVLEKRCGLHLSGHDAYVKVTGGLQLDEPAIDLSLAVALASSYREAPADPEMVVLGEVGLAGEVRSVAGLEPRLREAARMGFRRAVVPGGGERPTLRDDIEITAVRSLQDALQAALLTR